MRRVEGDSDQNILYGILPKLIKMLRNKNLSSSLYVNEKSLTDIKFTT